MPLAYGASHIKTLCQENSITLEYRASGGRAWCKSRRISIAPVRSEITYAVALHEIGHILGPHPSRRLDKEAAAWKWAMENALEWTPAMQARMEKSLNTYAEWFKRKWHRGVYVAPSASFDLLRGSMLTTSLPKARKGSY